MSSLYEQLDKFNYNNDINNFCLSDRVDMLRVKKIQDRYLRKEKIDNKKINLPQYNFYKINFG